MYPTRKNAERLRERDDEVAQIPADRETGGDGSEVGNPLGLRPADFYPSLPNFCTSLAQVCKLGNLQVPRLVPKFVSGEGTWEVSIKGENNILIDRGSIQESESESKIEWCIGHD